MPQTKNTLLSVHIRTNYAAETIVDVKVIQILKYTLISPNNARDMSHIQFSPNQVNVALFICVVIYYVDINVLH